MKPNRTLDRYVNRKCKANNVSIENKGREKLTNFLRFFFQSMQVQQEIEMSDICQSLLEKEKKPEN